MRTARFVLSVLFVAAVAIGSPRARADEAAVRAVMDAMERAVLAGDPEAYLAHVATADAIFLREQRMWAADLKRHVPVEFRLLISRPEPPPPPARDEVAPAPEAKPTPDAPPAEATAPPAAPPSAPPAPPQAFEATFGTDRAAFVLKMSWRMGDDVDPPGRKLREVSYPAAFVRVDGAWRYAGEVWESVERPPDEATGFAGVRVLFPPGGGLGEAASAVGDQMPLVRRRVDALFDLRIDRVQEVKLYQSMLHLQASIYLSYTDGLGGWNEPHESVKILSRSRPRAAQLRNLLGHEYGHVATFEVWPESDKAPWWLLEGLADFAAGHVAAAEGEPSGGPGRGADRRVVAWHNAGKLADWADISDFRKTPGELTGHVYRQGEHFVRWFTSAFGDAARNRWLRLLGAGKPMDEACASVTGKSFADLDKAWREAVKKLAQEQDQAGAEKPND